MFNGRFGNQQILIFLFILSVFILSITKIEDYDTWMHLGFGRLIWELKGLPDKEPFVYPIIDKPFFYNSWLFGLTVYLSYLSFDIYGVILFKAITVTIAFYILVRDSLRPYNNHVATIVVMIGVVVVSRHRFVERPDIFVMVFLSFSIFSLNAFIYDNKKYIFFLPVVHLLWANSHASITLIFLTFLSFLIGGVMQVLVSKRIAIRTHSPSVNFFSGTPTVQQLKVIAWIFIISLAASLINPFFLSQYTYGAEILASEWFKKGVSEFKPPTWQTNKWPYLIAPLVASSFILNWFVAYKTRVTTTDNLNISSKEKGYASLIHLFLVIPAVLLSFKAGRFTYLLAIISGPVLARNISAILAPVNLKTGKTCIIISLIVLYSLLILAGVEPLAFEGKRKKFGFGVNYDFFPEKALKYMDSRGITGRVFNTFHWGQYITWRDFPKRTPFVDGRGNISYELLEKMENLSFLNELYRKYGFESILINYPPSQKQIPETLDIDVAMPHPDWALVYWDDLSLLYLKKGGRYNHIIKKDSYQFIKPANKLNSLKFLLKNDKYSPYLINELNRNISETDSFRGHMFLGYAYIEFGKYDMAINELSKVKDFPILSQLHLAYQGIAYAYVKKGDPGKAISYSKKALSIHRNAATLYNIGILYMRTDDKRIALKYLKDALKSNGDPILIYPLLIRLYNELDMKDDAKKSSERYKALQGS